ncbi:MAG: 30S ribosomal protein S5 [Candidatus Sungbacteria bacterium RIFCSPLOWO2_02_FULL_51_17]|uniref:Small ribosomal subunit protein uS5 n=1 Tax=Candidatus Sungbacteria bacterium RIFCSPHIGHO2_02_FULL_51_29 TaxID=1802273 RepID=A0A1G2KSS3_9BACT|nr:MAG: 30S ribosomal protein S5 [Candidatus Sungbacteria bacterium RIFCSPHIGHO2_01_FULL_51_22]OHA02480.1 MAG: 30S ribosomal protein S5 [Candidatus Sungbacteria bacterium RIFCSPHIGHO2_02_FULL_51_29]OHA07938.1 MAG: 30S ribosomal protein S5 [Candidatus Sungbacteria bacterium RIFCSPLOWO2_01_FULL_51_34]OHA11942.1 MAG: 30S ribosomal protein S5 [Candidatus Sungbacteria bacterium RIFCSPLOWO2_02_FULL_51_17]
MRELRQKKEKSEFDQKVLDIRRTARVVKGGRRFSFRATVVIGNRTGRVGVGVGKGPDVSSAVEKAVNQAKKNTIKVVISKHASIPHEVMAKTGSAVILLKPAPAGSGIIAGGPVRVVTDLAGIQNISAKILSRTTNKLNNARATIEALKKI